ncbi:MAG: HAD family hydrolase [Nitrososphaerales archaeon]
MSEASTKNRRIHLIAFDADDTLWHSENLYAAAQAKFAGLMAPYAGESTALSTLHETEIRNLQPYGFGVKAFVLSMIETAIQLSQGRVDSNVVAALLATGKDMLAAEVELLDGVEEAVSALAAEYPLMVITKGDLGHQASKLERSGLAQHFRYVEIVADKNREVYVILFAKHGIDPSRVLMVGNSLKSDVIPVLELGGWGVFAPYAILWAHEHAELPETLAPRFREIARLDLLPGVVQEIENSTQMAQI